VAGVAGAPAPALKHRGDAGDLQVGPLQQQRQRAEIVDVAADVGVQMHPDRVHSRRLYEVLSAEPATGSHSALSTFYSALVSGQAHQSATRASNPGSSGDVMVSRAVNVAMGRSSASWRR